MIPTLPDALDMRTNPERLLVVRLFVRHTGELLEPSRVAYLQREVGLFADDIRHAQMLGMRDRAIGVTCRCRLCEVNQEKLLGNASLRTHYYLRRRAELLAAGKTAEQIHRIVDEEIDAGAAMQSAPVTITRTVGGGDDE